MQQPTIFIVGTDHGFQTKSTRFPDAKHSEFTDFITQIIRTNGIAAICEENHPDALAEHNLLKSVPELIAKSLQLKHLHCDPNLQERALLGIRQEASIRLQNWPKMIREEDVIAQMREANCLRETYWLQKVSELNVWPILFICGATHVESLTQLATKHAKYPVLLAADWGA